MARPRKGTEAVFFDTFADWSAEDQAAALRVLEALHRQKKREEAKPLSQRIVEQLPVHIDIPAAPTSLCPTCSRAMMDGEGCADSYHIPF